MFVLPTSRILLVAQTLNRKGSCLHIHLARAASKQIKLKSRAKMPLSFTEVDTALRILWLNNVKELVRLVGLQVC